MSRLRVLAAVLALALSSGIAHASDITLLVVDTDDGKMRVVNQSTGAVLSETQLTEGGDDLTSVHGMTVNGTGVIYLAYQTDGGFDVEFVPEFGGSDSIGTLNVTTGVVTNVVDTETSFSGLAFGTDGGLYGMSTGGFGPAELPGFGDMLYEIDLGDGDADLINAFESMSQYSPIALNPQDGLIYRLFDDEGDYGFESFDPDDVAGTLVNIGLNDPGGDLDAPFVSLAWDPAGYFLAADADFNLFRITTGGDVTYVTGIDYSTFPEFAPIIIVNPEPASLALYGLGLLAVAGMARRRRRRTVTAA